MNYLLLTKRFPILVKDTTKEQLQAMPEYSEASQVFPVPSKMALNCLKRAFPANRYPEVNKLLNALKTQN